MWRQRIYRFSSCQPASEQSFARCSFAEGEKCLSPETDNNRYRSESWGRRECYISGGGESKVKRDLPYTFQRFFLLTLSSPFRPWHFAKQFCNFYRHRCKFCCSMISRLLLLYALSQNTRRPRNEKYKFMNINSKIWIHLASGHERKMLAWLGLLAPGSFGSPIAVHSLSIIFMGHYSSKENMQAMWALALCMRLLCRCRLVGFKFRAASDNMSDEISTWCWLISTHPQWRRKNCASMMNFS